MVAPVLILLMLGACKKSESGNPSVTAKGDSLVSGAGYANDIYYSMANGIVKVVDRKNWDLAFATTPRSASILINSGNLDSLFVWKGGSISDFNTVSTLDIAGNLSTNLDDTSWYNNSAFEQGMNLSNPYDAGWGIYNINTHDVIGDSVYILKLTDGSYRKIAILARYGADQTYKFIIANLESGAQIDTVVIQTNPYITKNFVYYSVANMQTISDREPDNSTWDFVFTKYDSRIPYYPLVTGLLTNEGISTAKLTGEDTTLTYSQATYTKALTGIGFNWKSFNGVAYDIVNPLYFIKTLDGHYYKIRFLSFDYTTGTLKFTKTLEK